MGRKEYNVYYAAGGEEMKNVYNLYSDDDAEIIQVILKMVMSLSKYQDVKKQWIVKHENKQILNITF